MKRSKVALTFASLVLTSSTLGMTGCVGYSSSDDDYGSPALYGSPISSTKVVDTEDQPSDLENPKSEDMPTDDQDANQDD